MKKRKRMTRKQNKRNFRSGNRVKSRNFKAGPMRGGVRL